MSARNDAWQQYADAVGGRFESVETGVWIFKGCRDRVLAPVGRWWLTLDEFTQTSGDSTPISAPYTRLTVPHVGLAPFDSDCALVGASRGWSGCLGSGTSR